MKKPSRWSVCHMLAALFSFAFVAPIVAMWTDQSTPILIERTELLPKDVKPGEVIRLTWTARELRGCEGTIHRQFVDSAGVIFDMVPVPTIYREVLKEGIRSFSRDIQVPSGMAPGPAIFGGKRRYWCNPLQRMMRGIFGTEIILDVTPVKFNIMRTNSLPGVQ